MSLKIIEKGAMAAFVAGVMDHYTVVGPQVKAQQAVGREQFAFGPLTDPDQLRLDYNTTILPPKKHLLPQEETLFTFRTADPLGDAGAGYPPASDFRRAHLRHPRHEAVGCRLRHGPAG